MPDTDVADFDVIVIGAGRRARTSPAGAPTGACRSPSSSGSWWGANARTGAASRRRRCCVVTYPTGDVAGAYTLGDGIRGTSQLVVDDACRVIVGATFTGPGVAELLHSATTAIVGEVTLDRLWHAVPSFPTVSEVWLRLLEAYGL